MIEDELITFDELVDYESELRDFIDNAKNMKEIMANLQELVIKNMGKFEDPNSLLEDFEIKRNAIESDSERVNGFVLGLIDFVTEPEHDKKLNDMSDELVEIIEG